MEFLHPAMWHVAVESWQWIHKWQHPTMWYVALGWHATGFAQTTHIGILQMVSVSTTSPQSTCHSAPDSEILCKSDHSQQKKNDDMSILKMADLNHLGSYGSNNGFFEKPNYITSYRSSLDTIALNCLFFEKIAFLHFDDRQTNKQTDGQHRCTKPLSVSRAAA